MPRSRYERDPLFYDPDYAVEAQRLAGLAWPL